MTMGEFCNAIVSAMMDTFGVAAHTGTVRHPQSQGGVECFQQTLLLMIRKLLDELQNWLSELDVLLVFYRTRTHSLSKISPMMAMMVWEPCTLVANNYRQASSSAWVDKTAECAAVCTITLTRYCQPLTTSCCLSRHHFPKLMLYCYIIRQKVRSIYLLGRVAGWSVEFFLRQHR